MKRKTFLQLSASLAAGSVVTPIIGCLPEQKKAAPSFARMNWAGNYRYKAEGFHQPKSVAEVQELVKKLDKQKALGSTHCFNDIADSPKNQISTMNLDKVIAIDENEKTVTVEGGAKYGQFAPQLHEKGYALHNLASLPHISVAGACATGTHGSGVKNGNLATPVRALEMVTPDGEVLNLSRDKDGDRFKAAVVGLGALGIVTKVTLDILPTFEVVQNVFLDLPLQAMKDHFEEIMSAGYSVSLFTDWQNKKVSQIWVKRKVEPGMKPMAADFFGAKAADRDVHPIIALSAENCTPQMGVPGPWHERLPHFKMGFMPSSGEELQSEFFVAKENAVDALLALEKKGAEIFPELMISEIRTIAADDLWMSPHYQRDSVAVHCTWKQHTPEVTKLVTMIEAELAPFAPRPHWGKLFTLDPKVLQSRYERHADFLALAKELDAAGKFRNEYLNRNIYPV